MALNGSAALLIFLFSNQGYWLAGTSGAIDVKWNLPAQTPRAILHWRLLLGQVALAQDEVALDGQVKTATLKIICPSVRVRTAMRWEYQVVEQGSKKELESGALTIHAFPPQLTHEWANRVAERLGRQRLVVVEPPQPGTLNKALSDAGLQVAQLNDPSKLATEDADVVLVGEDQVDQSPFSQSPLLELAQRGTSILLLSQTRPQRLIGYPLVRQALNRPIDWMESSPLLARLEGQDFASWRHDLGAEAMALQISPSEPVLELAWLRPEAISAQPLPLDVLALTKTIDKGRIVLWQLPLGNLQSDPRAQALLAGAVDYLLTMPVPTPPASQRSTTQPLKEPSTPPTINVSPGANP